MKRLIYRWLFPHGRFTRYANRDGLLTKFCTCGQEQRFHGFLGRCPRPDAEGR